MTTLPPGPPPGTPPPGTPLPVPPPAARALSLGDILVSVGALVGFSFSFAPFVQWSEQAREELGPSSGISVRFNAWSLEMFLVPLTTFVIMALLLAAAGTWTRFALRRDPSVVGFRFRQLEVGLTLFAFAVLLAMVVSDKTIILGYDRFADAGLFLPDDGRADTGWGAVLMLLGALVALAGAVLNHLGLALSIGVHMNRPPAPYPGQHPSQHPGQHPGQHVGQHPGQHPGQHLGQPTAPYQSVPLPAQPPPTPPPTQPPPTPPFPAQREPSQFDPPEPGSS